MANTNTNWFSMSDKSIVSILGAYIKHQRLIQNKTQAKIAEAAGVNRWTMSKIENGEPVSLTSFIQILRALHVLDILKVFEIQHQVSPMELAKLDKQKRQRARGGQDEIKQNESEW